MDVLSHIPSSHASPSNASPPLALALALARPLRTSSLACLECRRQHLRCDAGQPACRRCVSARRPCYYAPSRRGRKRRREDGHDAVAVTMAATTATTATTAAATADSQLVFPGPLHADTSNVLELDHNSLQTDNISDVFTPAVHYASENGSDDHLVDLYYAYFHRAHPFLVPRPLYHAQQYPRYLQLAVQFVGSHYASTKEGRSAGASPCQGTEVLRDRATQILALADSMADSAAEVNTHRIVAMVQALTMMAIALHARHELAASDRAVARALQLAVDRGMHRRPFASSSRTVQHESWRRTWWELYIVDGYLTALHHRSVFRSGGIGANVLLPCEEDVYARAADGERLPPPLSLDDFDARLFSSFDSDGDNDSDGGSKDVDTMHRGRFSSFAYRIDAVRLLGRVLAVTRTSQAQFHNQTETRTRTQTQTQTQTQAQDSFSSVDSALAGWQHHLHPSKTDVVRLGVGRDGSVIDEMLFQAHMLVHYATLVLHCPRSDLVVTLPAAARISCGQADGLGPGPGAAAHAARATRASTRLSGLAALCAPVVQEHTPFFVCGLLLGATVQLAACASRPALRWPFRDSILLAIGVLKTLGRTWALAHNALRLLRDVAGEVLQQSVHSSDSSSGSGAGGGGGAGGVHAGVNIASNVLGNVQDWPARAMVDAGTATSGDGDAALAAFSDLVPSPGFLQTPNRLDSLNQMDQLEQWTLPLMLQLNDHQSSQSTSLC
ncbi:C6 transcription factor [Sporothrix schenckii 1099-18]|uniref:C6 transcription factor n=1 Tax=Sporothrix schenckii 1099-18 TaxID=1397361 RepID=A0A0F2LU94_SPOSC|nr:C6 transcription factor [Sporothrix schenckii 1099-18]KJR81027.1 C6 transcription factor [Sporothrix schenckii 1099-18]